MFDVHFLIKLKSQHHFFNNYLICFTKKWAFLYYELSSLRSQLVEWSPADNKQKFGNWPLVTVTMERADRVGGKNGNTVALLQNMKTGNTVALLQNMECLDVPACRQAGVKNEFPNF